MKKFITKAQFENLDRDDKAKVFEEYLTDDFFNGQSEINFWVPENFDPNSSHLPTPPDEVRIREEKEIDALFDKLTIKLFEDREVVEVDW
jgi:peroxiredoxin